MEHGTYTVQGIECPECGNPGVLELDELDSGEDVHCTGCHETNTVDEWVEWRSQNDTGRFMSLANKILRVVM